MACRPRTELEPRHGRRELLERKFHKGSFAAIALQAAPARFAHTPALQDIAHKQQPAHTPGHSATAAADPFLRSAKTKQHAAQPSATGRDWPQAALRDLQLGACITVAGRQEGEAPMIVVSEDRLKHTNTHIHTHKHKHTQ
jgi:hypothetical protein